MIEIISLLILVESNMIEKFLPQHNSAVLNISGMNIAVFGIIDISAGIYYSLCSVFSVVT